MTDILENIGLLTALMLAGVGMTFVVLIMLIKFIDFLDNKHD